MGSFERVVADRTTSISISSTNTVRVTTTASAAAATADAVVVATQSHLPPANRHRTLVSISSSSAPSDATGAHLVDERSDSTINSSERSSQQSEDGSESSEETGAFGDEYDEDDDLPTTGGDGAQTRYLLKPMPSLLQVCPVDDLAVEDEKRRRRHSRNNSSSGSSHKKRPSADAESLPSAPSPLLLRHQQASSTQTTGLATPSSHGSSGAAPAPPLLRRDSMAIRQQYWKQLGFNLTRSDLERTTGRRSVRHKGLKVRLNDDGAAKKGGASKNFFQFIASWYNPTDSTESDASPPPLASRHSAALASALSPARGSGASSPAAARKAIRFDDEAELFYIPLHTDYSKRQRDCMWHTRVEFVAMVERNLEDVYDEMEREYEEQVEAEDLANEQMAQEEARQRKVEAEQLRAMEASRAAAAAATAAAATRAAAISRATLSPVLRGRSPLPQQLPAAPVPTLALCPSETQIKLAAPRGRSPHAIRFQYLKHLGIPNSKNS